MLVITRKIGEAFDFKCLQQIHGKVVILDINYREKFVRIGIDAPRYFEIERDNMKKDKQGFAIQSAKESAHV